MKAAYGDRGNFITVYVIEPHPLGSACPYKKNGEQWWVNYPTSIYDEGGSLFHPLFQPRTYTERVAQAKSMIQHLKVSTPVLIDEMDNPFWSTYGCMPNCAYLISMDGTVIKGESWYQPEQLEATLKNYFNE